MRRKTIALCIYTCDCPISVSIHFNINFSHISHRVFDFCHLICPLSYFITQTSWLHCSAWPQKLLFSHHRMWHTFPPAHASHTHTTHTYRQIQMHLESTGKTFRITSLEEFLGPGHLRFLLHVWPIKSALKWGKRGAMSEWHKGKRKKVPCCLPNTINI